MIYSYQIAKNDTKVENVLQFFFFNIFSLYLQSFFLGYSLYLQSFFFFIFNLFFPWIFSLSSIFFFFYLFFLYLQSFFLGYSLYLFFSLSSIFFFSWIFSLSSIFFLLNIFFIFNLFFPLDFFFSWCLILQLDNMHHFVFITSWLLRAKQNLERFLFLDSCIDSVNHKKDNLEIFLISFTAMNIA